MRGIRVTATGGPDVLEPAELDDPTPGPTDVIVRVAAAGVNFIDTYHRSGLYPMPLPFTPGMEAAGTVVAARSAAGRFAVGDRVAWAGVPGAYAALVRVPQDSAVLVPVDVPLDIAAAVPLQGMTAHFLVTDTFPLGKGHRCLVHAGAGGVGLLLIQIAKMLGAEVVTTVGSRDKEAIVREAGADHVVFYREVDFATAIEESIGRRAIDVVYDGVGKATFARSLDVLRPRGMMITFGNASGPVDPITPLQLMQGGSLYLTRPMLTHYIATREDLERRAADLFEWIAAGRLQIRIGDRFPLAAAADAHRRLESRGSAGKILLLPESD